MIIQFERWRSYPLDDWMRAELPLSTAQVSGVKLMGEITFKLANTIKTI